MPAAQWAVTIAALGAGAICFGLYVYGTIVAIGARADAARSLPRSADPAAAPRALGVEDVGRLADALSRLTDSLARASPALTALIGALVFFAIAAVSSGALRG